jgi:glycosidase
VAGDEASLAREPRNYRRVEGGRVIAYGRDPFFDGWPDTFQLDYSNPALRSAMQAELARVARLCDGVRCDMAMLVLPEVFERTWGRATEPFWPRATSAVRAARPGFLFLAEVYWDLEWTLQQQGFDYTYDKRLYDRLAHGAARAVRDHLRAGLDFQDRLARFLENHDEPRAAATFAPERHRAAAIVTFLAPGLRFLHQGQREGRRIRVPVHLGRGPEERVDAELGAFYDRLLATLRDRAVREGEWRLLEARAAWEGNPTWDDFIAFAWTRGGERRLVVVNFSDHRSQCWLPLPWGELGGATVRLRDRTGPAVYDRDARELAARGLYLDLPAWGYHVFEVAPA